MGSAETVGRFISATARRHVAVIAFSILGVFIVAFAYIALLEFTAPANGRRPEPSFSELLDNWPFALELAVVIGFVVAPFAYLCTLRRSIPRAFAFCLAIVLVEIVCVTPIAPGLAFVASFLEFALALLLCVVLPKDWLVARDRRAAAVTTAAPLRAA